MLDQSTSIRLASLYATYPAAQAKRLADKVEIHRTPKHGSWLNMAELELAVLQPQCPRQRLPDQAAMDRVVTAWATRRNAVGAAVDWQFTTADACGKLRRFYPVIDT